MIMTMMTKVIISWLSVLAYFDDGNEKAINLKLQLPPWQWLPQDSLGCSQPLGHLLQHPPWFKVILDDDYNDDDDDWDGYHGNQKLAIINLFIAAAIYLSHSWPKVIIFIIVIVTITMIMIMILTMIMIMIINLFIAATLSLSYSWPKVIIVIFVHICHHHHDHHHDDDHDHQPFQGSGHLPHPLLQLPKSDLLHFWSSKPLCRVVQGNCRVVGVPARIFKIMCLNI